MLACFRRPITHNFSLKLLSFVLAMALWFSLAPKPATQVANQGPIPFRNGPGNLGLSYQRIPPAQNPLRGPERAKPRLQTTRVQAEVDLTEGKPGNRTFSSSSVY